MSAAKRKGCDAKPEYYKILHKDMVHNGFKYAEGLNVDHHPFNPDGRCSSGGLYFSDREHITCFFGYGSLIARVTLPEDAKLVQEDSEKFKADKIILSDIRPIDESELWNDPSFCLAAVQKRGNALKYVKQQTPEICLAAVRQDGSALEIVKDQTSEICLAAIQQNGCALEHVKKQTPELCLAAKKIQQ